MSKLLSLKSRIIVGPLTKPFNARQFFRARRGFICGEDFYRRFVSGVDVVPSATERLLSAFRLKTNAYDFEIKAELPKNTRPVDLWQIAWLTERQWKGQAGSLLCGEDDANLFYKDDLVLVLGRGCSEWGLDAYSEAQTDLWNPGTLVFVSHE